MTGSSREPRWGTRPWVLSGGPRDPRLRRPSVSPEETSVTTEDLGRELDRDSEGA